MSQTQINALANNAEFVAEMAWTKIGLKRRQVHSWVVDAKPWMREFVVFLTLMPEPDYDIKVVTIDAADWERFTR